jgi:hypothetical protein
MRGIKDITSYDLDIWRKSIKSCKTVGEGKAKAREFRDMYDLNDIESTNILFRNYNISTIINARSK